MIPSPVSENRRIKDFAASATFPCIKGADEIIILFSVHAAFAFGTFHGVPPFMSFMYEPTSENYLDHGLRKSKLHEVCQNGTEDMRRGIKNGEGQSKNFFHSGTLGPA